MPEVTCGHDKAAMEIVAVTFLKFIIEEVIFGWFCSLGVQAWTQLCKVTAARGVNKKWVGGSGDEVGFMYDVCAGLPWCPYQNRSFPFS